MKLLNKGRTWFASGIVLTVIGLIFAFQNCSTSDSSSNPNSGNNSQTTNCPGGNCDCTFNGQTLADGSGTTAYQNSTEAFGSTCVSETRSCTQGVLSGSFAYANCTVNAPSACLFNGTTMGHGTDVTAYQNPSVPFGSACVSETRSCQDGNLSGSYLFDACSVGAPAACLFNGQSVNHGDSTAAFLTSTVPFGQTCQQESRTCTDGSLSGSYDFASCNVDAPASCLFNGATVAHGQDVLAFQTSTVPFGSTCTQETRTCDNGNMTGSFLFASCNVDAPASCLFNGATVAHGQNVQAYQTANVPYGSTCTQETRSCDNGNLTGTYTFDSCVVLPGADCTFNGQTVAHGTSVTAYKNPSPNNGGNCQSQSRLCTNGTLSGNFTYAACQ